VSFTFIMTTSVTRSRFTEQQTCKTKTKIKTAVYKTKTKTDFFVSDWSNPKTSGLGPHHRFRSAAFLSVFCHCWLGHGKGIWLIKNLASAVLKVLWETNGVHGITRSKLWKIDQFNSNQM